MGKRRIEIARVYDLPDSDDHFRVLVDRLWPRGVKKESLHLDKWPKKLAPSNELRQWFGHDVARWDEFRNRYREELTVSASDVEALLEAAGEKPVLLVYAAKDTNHNNAIVLKNFMESIGDQT